jgi:NAD(P)-dependent dehydrogenase (short-subunit alcohol dehydrogenase family)
LKIDLYGKTAIVTGSTDGIGFAIAHGIAACGATVVINGRKPAGVDRAMAALRAAVPGAEPRGVATDLATADGCAALVEAERSCDILVNNVGIYGPQDFFDIPDSEWTRYFELNVMSGVRLARAYMPAMLQRNWGRVVFLSSEAGVNIPPEMIHYGFTKTAVLAIARGLAKRAAGTGVTVNSVLPGPTFSEGLEDMLRSTADSTGESIERTAQAFVEAAMPSSIIRRVATPEEVANMVVYAVSPQASATTGAALRVDGGIVDTIG